MKELVLNVPSYAKENKYWIATNCDNDLWFYGAFNENEPMVQNVPDYAKDYPIWVITMVDDEFWFYGAYDETDKEEILSMTLDYDKKIVMAK